jgi:acyl-CoA synthetase (AMP-forming)/AMP-acid ligase II
MVSFSNSLSNVLKSRQLVVHITNNSYESIAGYVSFIRNRVVSLMLPIDTDIKSIENILNMYKPKYIYLPKILQTKFHFEQLICFDEFVLLDTNFLCDYTISQDLALLLSTSGSTGSIKFVRQTYTNIYENARSISQYLNIASSDTSITNLPMNYTYMLSVINSHFLVGASITSTNLSIMQKEFWKLLKDTKVTAFAGVPFTYEMIRRLDFDKLDLTTIKYFTQAGGKLSNEHIKYFMDKCEKTNKQFIVMYGQTEATARISYLPWEYRDKLGSIGIAIPNGKMWIEDNNTVVTQPFKKGELVYSGLNVTAGYSQNCYDLDNYNTVSNMLKTGDMAMFDDDGFFYITGRMKRFVKIYGNRINLDELEKIAKDYNVIISGNDKRINIYSLNDNKEVVTILSKKIKQNKNIFKFIQVDQFIRNEAGKVQYKKMDEKYGT